MKKENPILKIISVVLLFCMILGMTPTSTVYAASLYEHCPIQAYPLVNKAITYDLITGQKCGYAAKNDLCKILRIFDDDEIVIEYPLDSGGTKIARVKIKDFFLDSDLDSRSLVNIGKNLIVYKDKECTKTFGELYCEDNALIVEVDHVENVTQVLYQITGTNSWKMGFVRGVYDPDSGFEKVDIKEGYYMIFSSTNPSFGIDVYRAYTDNGANLQLYRRQNSANQVFVILKYNDGYVIFCYHADGKVWDVDMSNGNVLQWYFHGGENQIWDAFRTPSGEIVFKNRGNGKYLDVANNVMADEVNIGTHFFNNSSAEKFILQPVIINGVSYKDKMQLEDNSSNNTVTQKAQEVVDCALSYLGVSDYYGNNDVIFNTWYWKQQIRSSGYAWCQAYVSFVANECGVLNTAIPRTARCADAVQWYKERGLFEYSGGTYEPKPGDLVFYGSEGKEHVGIIVDYCKNGYLQVVEGNVKDDATGHYKVTLFTKNSRRTLDSDYVYGYGKVDYR